MCVFSAWPMNRVFWCFVRLQSVNVATPQVHRVTGRHAHRPTFVPKAAMSFIKTSSIMNSSGKVLLGVLAGIAAGATLGILFAPDKGSNTRKKIVDKSNDYADDLTERFNEFVDGVNKKVDSLSNKAGQMAQNVNHKAEGIMDEAKTSMKSNH